MTVNRKCGQRGSRFCRFGAWIVATVVALAVFAPLAGFADATIGTVYDFEAAGDVDLWHSDGVLTHEEAGGMPDGWMQIAVDLGENPEDPEFQRVWIDRADLFDSTWDAVAGVAFNFYVGTAVPSSVQLQFSNTTDSDIWSYQLPALTLGWNSFSASFGDVSNWSMPFGTDFMGDLADLDWLGLAIYPSTADEEIYGIDNFRLMVPEPHEYVLLAAALIVALVAVRRERLLRQPVA